MTTCAPTSLDEALDAAALDVLPDALAVHRLTRTPDSSGGTTEAYVPVVGLGAVPCRIGTLSSTGGGEAIVADRLGILDGYGVTVPAATDILVTDRLAVGQDTFHVQAAPRPGSLSPWRRLIATVVE